ncbi:MAG: hypothetical protein K2R93_16550, partial [Gemmatimonadaceae bacterium]|nr:hypothetical protein [Gemmatimonadaceae bacterium]
MTRPAVVWLEATQAWILPGSASSGLVSVPLAPRMDADGVPDLAPVRDACVADGAPRELVLVIGGSWLQCARPALPPLAPADRRRALHHQADRFFTVRGPIASTVYDRVAVACSASWLAGVREQCAAWTTLRAVVALPEAAAAAALTGDWHAPASPTLLVTLRDGTVADARVTRGAAPTSSRAIDPTSLLRGVQQAAAQPWPRERQ